MPRPGCSPGYSSAELPELPYEIEIGTGRVPSTSATMNTTTATTPAATSHHQRTDRSTRLRATRAPTHSLIISPPGQTYPVVQIMTDPGTPPIPATGGQSTGDNDRIARPAVART